MGNLNAKELDVSDFQSLETEFGFNQEKIKRLYDRFVNLDRRQCGTLCQEDLMRIPAFAQNPLGNRIIGIIFSTYDETNFLKWKSVNEINFRHFLTAYAIFAKPTGSHVTEAERQNNIHRRKFQLRFYTKLHDIMGKGYLDRADLTAIVKRLEDQTATINDILNDNKRSDEIANCNLEAHEFEIKMAETLEKCFGTQKEITYEDFEEILNSLKFHEIMDFEILNSLII